MEFEERARAVLPPHISAYYAAPTGSEAKGTLDWSAIRFRPRVLRDIALPTPLEDSPRYARTDTGSGRADGPREPSSNRISGLLLHHLLDQRLRARSRPS